jgi:hypothetical protein
MVAGSATLGQKKPPNDAVNRGTTMPTIQEAMATLEPRADDDELMTWRSVAAATGYKDPAYARKVFQDSGAPLVQLSTRRRIPRKRTVRALIASREAI